jgi:carbon monoxide dehydrogenase subunit G
MATLIREITIDASPQKCWEALRDFGALHQKLVPGFVTHCEFDGAARTITFFNGMKVREALVGIDDAQRRVAYSASGANSTHHNASAQIFDDGTGRTRFVWITDVLPDSSAEFIGPMMDQGAVVIKKTLEGR